MTTSNSIYNLLPLPLLLLCLLYIIIGCLAWKRFFGFVNTKYIGMLGKLFYGLLSVICLIRSILFIILGIASMGAFVEKKTESVYYFAMNIIYIPEFLLWIACTFLFWQYLILFYISHINFSLSSKAIDVLPVPLRSNSFNIMIFMIVIFVIIQSIFVILFDTHVFDLNFLLVEDLVINYSLPIVALCTQLILHLKFSGAPYISLIYKEKKEKMMKIIFYWIIGRFLKATFSIILYSLQGDIVNDFIEDSLVDKNDQLTQIFMIIIFFINYFFVEIFAFSLCVNKGIAKIFQLYEYTNPMKDNQILLNQEINNFNFAESDKKSREETIDNKIDFNEFYKNIDLSKLELDERYDVIINSSKFGTIKKGYYLSKPMAIRSIDIENISNFIIEEVQEDMTTLIKLNWNQIVPIKGIYYDEKKIILMSEFLEDISLENFFSKPTELLINDDDPKLRVAWEIAKTLCYMHENNIVHGHLSPSNIFITNKYKAKIVDCGFKGLKKLISLQKGYCNKSQYTAPEHLKERNLIVKTRNKASDVYSFGIILWEIVERKKSFENMNIKYLSLCVVERQSRPKISEGIQEKIAQLIRACWQEDVEKRPNFKVICKILEQNLN